MSGEQAYNIKIEVFEGPFDLLCHLIEKNKIDIYDIPISIIADQYMEYLFSLQEFNIDIASEFLVMASTLLHIKSRLMLPVKKDDDDDLKDPRDELVISVIEYKKYKEFATTLRNRGEYWYKAVYKFPEIIDAPASNCTDYNDYHIDGEGLFEIYKKLQDANKKRFEYDETRIEKIVENEKVSLISKLKEIVGLLRVKASFIFGRIFNPTERTKSDVVTAFFALLELNRQEYVNMKQERIFGDIKILRRKTDLHIDFKKLMEIKD